MKINPLYDAYRALNIVRKKEDGESGGHQEQRQQRRENESESEFSEVLEVTEEKVAEAVEAFSSDKQNQASGINASVDGSGPGLKVALKDGTGNVMRLLTGEEFLKMREAAAKGDRTRGKILDQKL